MKKKYVLILVLILTAAVGAAVASLMGRDSAKWKEQARVLEADKAAAAGLLVASRASESDLAKMVDTLNEQIDDLNVAVGKKPKVKTVIRTRTNPINVDAKRLLVEADDKINALNETIRALNESRPEADPCPECPGIEALLLGADDEYFQFEIGSVSAELESDAGNTFLVGEGELFLTAPVGLAGSLGSAPYRTDVSEIFVTTPPEALPVHRYVLGIDRKSVV